MNKDIKKYVKELQKVLKGKSVDELIAFLERNEGTIIEKDFVDRFKKANRETQEMTLRKMICERTDLPSELRKRSAEWLLVRGYYPGVDFNGKED